MGCRASRFTEYGIRITDYASPLHLFQPYLCITEGCAAADGVCQGHITYNWVQAHNSIGYNTSGTARIAFDGCPIYQNIIGTVGIMPVTPGSRNHARTNPLHDLNCADDI